MTFPVGYERVPDSRLGRRRLLLGLEWLLAYRRLRLPRPDAVLAGSPGAAVLEPLRLLLHVAGEQRQRPRLSREVDRDLVLGRGDVEGGDELLPLPHLPLEDPAEV